LISCRYRVRLRANPSLVRRSTLEKRALNPATWLVNAFNVNEAIEVKGDRKSVV